MSLLDAGTDVVLVYPQVAAVDDYTGAPSYVRDVEPVEVRCRVQPLSTEDLIGDLTGTAYRLIARTFPSGPFALVRWNGRDWDLRGEPERHNGSPNTAHVTVILEARSPEVA